MTILYHSIFSRKCSNNDNNISYQTIIKDDIQANVFGYQNILFDKLYCFTNKDNETLSFDLNQMNISILKIPLKEVDSFFEHIENFFKSFSPTDNERIYIEKSFFGAYVKYDGTQILVVLLDNTKNEEKYNFEGKNILKINYDKSKSISEWISSENNKLYKWCIKNGWLKK